MYFSDKMIPKKAILTGLLCFSLIILAFQFGMWTSEWQRKSMPSIILAPTKPSKIDKKVLKKSEVLEKQIVLVKREIKTLQSRAKKIEQELEKPHIKNSQKIKNSLEAKLSQILKQQENAARQLHSLKSQLSSLID